MNKLNKWLARALIIISTFVVLTPTALASTYGSGLYGSCQYNTCSITLSTDNSLNADVTPTASGKCSITADNVSVQTYNSSGYTLSLTTTTTNNSLTNGTSNITASTGTSVSPSALAINTWGFRVDSVGSFGAGPTTAQTNISPPSTTFAGVPASNQSPEVLANTSVPASTPDVTKVWYGVCADTTLSSGSYSTQTTYTAVTN